MYWGERSLGHWERWSRLIRVTSKSGVKERTLSARGTIPVLRSLEVLLHPSSSSLARQTLLPSWLRPEVLSPCRVPYTPPSRITKGPSTSHGTPKEVRNTSSPVVKIERSVCGTPTWAQKSRPTRPTATRFCQSRCKVLSAPINEARV